MSRLKDKFAALKKEGRAAFVPFITAGDPDMDTSFSILHQLPAAGADIIELGMPFPRFFAAVSWSRQITGKCQGRQRRKSGQIFCL